MSGGLFDYEQYKIIEIADKVEQIIIDNNKKDEFGYSNDFSKETIEEFKKGLKYLRLAQVYAQRIDWLVSCDDGEEGFHRRLKKDLTELKQDAKR